MRFKKILIVSDGNLNDGTGSGVTLSNLFRGWSLERLAVYSVKNDKTNQGILLGDDCFRVPAGKKHKHTNNPVKSTGIFDFARDWIAKSRIRSYLTLFAPVSITSVAEAQINNYDPEIIYAPVSDIFSIRRVMHIKKMTKANLGIVFFDDLIDRYDNLLFSAFYKWAHLRFLRRIVALAKVRYVCSEAMRVEYEGIFNVSFGVVSNPVDLEKIAAFRPKDPFINPFRIVYAGTVNSKNINNLKLMAQAVEHISEMGYEIKFNLYTFGAKLNVAQAQFTENEDCITVDLAPIDDMELFSLLGQASILYIPMDFSKESVKSIRLSYLTKQPLYMSLRVPLIVHGPLSIHVVEHAQAHGYADVVTDPSLDALVQSILDHINGYDKFVQRTDFGLAYAKENHCIKKVQESFYSRLLQP